MLNNAHVVAWKIDSLEKTDHADKWWKASLKMLAAASVGFEVAHGVQS